MNSHVISELLKDKAKLETELRDIEHAYIFLLDRLSYLRGQHDACLWLIRCYSFGGTIELHKRHYQKMENRLHLYKKSSVRYPYIHGYCDFLLKYMETVG